MDQLVGAAEIADRMRTSTNTVHSWRRRDRSFPAPVAVLRQTMVWDWRDVEAWARQTGRLPG